MEKEQELYRKYEIMLFRYFKIAKYLEYILKGVNLKGVSVDEILDPSGVDRDLIHIPFNPFYLEEEDKRIWECIFPSDVLHEEAGKSTRRLLEEVWKRIHLIKNTIGAIKNTRPRGESRKNRLIFILKRYLQTGILSDHFDFTITIFKRADREGIMEFLKFMKDKRKKNGIRSVMNYNVYNRKTKRNS